MLNVLYLLWESYANHEKLPHHKPDTKVNKKALAMTGDKRVGESTVKSYEITIRVIESSLLCQGGIVCLTQSAVSLLDVMKFYTPEV